MEIKIDLLERVNEEGRSYYVAEYDPDILKDLCLAIIADSDLGDAACMALAYKLSRENNPDEILDKIREMSIELRRENEPKTERRPITN